MKCPNCGKENLNGVSVCSNCGSILVSPKPMPSPSPKAPTPTPSAPSTTPSPNPSSNTVNEYREYNYRGYDIYRDGVLVESHYTDRPYRDVYNADGSVTSYGGNNMLIKKTYANNTVDLYENGVLAKSLRSDGSLAVRYESDGGGGYIAYDANDNEKFHVYGDGVVISFKYTDGKTNGISWSGNYHYDNETDQFTITEGDTTYVIVDRKLRKKVVSDVVTYLYDENEEKYLDEYEGGTKYYHASTTYVYPDGCFVTVGTNEVGTYNYNDKGELVCISETGNKYIYDSKGKILSKEDSLGNKVEFNYDKKSEIHTSNGGGYAYRINHIDFDEEKYNKILKSLVQIYDDSPAKIYSKFKSVEDTIAKFPEKYSTDKISELSKNVGDDFKRLDTLKEQINYSLLSYQACDDKLKSSLDKLIDSLFLENEGNAAKIFKKIISDNVEDSNGDGIIEYKTDTDFNNLANKLPVQSYVDEKGNILFFNEKGAFVTLEGKDAVINYGGVPFTVNVGKHGEVILKDKDGNPLNIFGDYNVDSSQYGGNQMDFEEHAIELLDDEKINRLFDKYFPDATPEEKMAYFQKICDTGCGFVAMTNVAFKSMEGYEEDFYEKFGYPMYDIYYDGEAVGVDYNYEPLVMELYSETWGGNKTIEQATRDGNGTSIITRDNMYNYLCKNYHIDDYASSSCTYIGDDGYNLLSSSEEGKEFRNGGSHAMCVTEIGEDGKTYVSSWGKKYLYEKSWRILRQLLDTKTYNSSKKEGK